jgi:hypothetical protein
VLKRALFIGCLYTVANQKAWDGLGNPLFFSGEKPSEIIL